MSNGQKASGEVFNKEAIGISLSNISSGGAARAEEKGKSIDASPHGSKGYKSTSERTQETFDALMRGYEQSKKGEIIIAITTTPDVLPAMAGTHFFVRSVSTV